MVVANATTRYGRLSYIMQSVDSSLRSASRQLQVKIGLDLPQSFAVSPPPGGLRTRIRAPAPWAGKLHNVTVGGTPWLGFDSVAETIDFTPHDLRTTDLSALTNIMATFVV